MWWCVSIASLKYNESKAKDLLTYDEMLYFCEKHGQINIDYEVQNAVEVFIKQNGEEEEKESINKTQAVIEVLKNRSI